MCPPTYIPFSLFMGVYVMRGSVLPEVLSYQIIPSAPHTRRDELTSKRVYRDRGISHIPIPLDIHRIFIKLQPFRFRLIPNFKSSQNLFQLHKLHNK